MCRSLKIYATRRRLFEVKGSVAKFETKRLEVSISIHFLNNILLALVLAFGIS